MKALAIAAALLATVAATLWAAITGVLWLMYRALQLTALGVALWFAWQGVAHLMR